MDNTAILLLIGFVIGTLGTLIGAGGGFILVPFLIFTHPQFSTEIITAISIAVVACNAISGSIAYARVGRIDYKAGIVFALFTIPGSILGVYTTRFIPKTIFHIVFGILLVILAILLFLRKPTTHVIESPKPIGPRWKKHIITDKNGEQYTYVYDQTLGACISVIVGYLSPLLGIGGGIIHVPALVNWLRFPVYIATATSHFILAIMASVSVMVHIINGSYNDPHVFKLTLLLSIGVLGGAQLGAMLSHKIRGQIIIRVLAVCLGLVGLRILMNS